jgi:hypothetical protein
VTGTTDSTDFPTTLKSFDRICDQGLSCYDAFVVEFNPTGSELLYSAYLGGSIVTGETGYGIALAANGRVYATGTTLSLDFPTTPGAYDQTLKGGRDVYVTSLGPTLSPPLRVAGIRAGYQPAGNGYRVGAAIAIEDARRSPVANATVTVQVLLPNCKSRTELATTDSRGEAQVSAPTEHTGRYVFTVIDVFKPGWLYEPAHELEASDSVTIP